MFQHQAPLFVPQYRPLQHGAWTLGIIPSGFMPGYWSGAVLAQNSAILHRNGTTWMSICPLEIESQEIGVRLAHGHVVVCGMGLGWAALALAARDAVKSVTVIERDPDILALHAELDLSAQLSTPQQNKLRIVEADALEWQAEDKVDCLLADIWQPLIDDVRLDHTRKMHRNIGADAVHMWGQELVLARMALAAGKDLDALGIAWAIAETGLPLVGMELPDYPALLAEAARRHLPELKAAQTFDTI
jgi:hypothetical protein